MIEVIVRSQAEDAAEVLIKALERSFSRTQVRIAEAPADTDSGIVFVAGPLATDLEWLSALACKRNKIVLLGELPAPVAALAGVAIQPADDRLARSAECGPAAAHGNSESEAAITYAATGLGAASPLQCRHLCRFDFTDEWNNLGYGRISVGEGAWAVAVMAHLAGAMTLGEIRLSDETPLGAVATVRDLPAASILWFARPVGPVDGPDWRIVESFISDYRYPELPCRPHLRDIPYGFAAAVTMRLDCDEAIASTRPLLELYRSCRRTLSVAVKTGQLTSEADLDMLAEVKAAGGAILSHSATHPPNWGGSSLAAEVEARLSKDWLEAQLPGASVRYAVSPFHQTPRYVPRALARAGYFGFIGGTISSDPEYLIARGGGVPHAPPGFVSHSQSCMLHGDCMLPGAEPMALFRQAFRNARAAGQFFAYLDHPFSERYSYGWPSERERVMRHADFLDFMQADCVAAGAPLLFVDEDTCLDFMREKAAAEMVFDQATGDFEISRSSAAGLPLAIGYGGGIRAAGHV